LSLVNALTMDPLCHQQARPRTPPFEPCAAVPSSFVL